MTKKIVFLSLIIGLAAMFLAAPWKYIAENETGNAYASGKAVRALGPRFPVERVWVLTIDAAPLGNITMVHTITAQDATGQRFTSWVQQINSNPTYFGFFDADSQSDWFGQTLRTGQNSYETTLVVYGTKMGESSPLAETVWIGVCTAEWQVIDRDNLSGLATLAIYLAVQDKDGDGLPDEGEEPVNCMLFPYTGKRLQMMPPCELTPM